MIIDKYLAKAYKDRATAKSVAKIGVLEMKRHAPQPLRFFCAYSSAHRYGGLNGAVERLAGRFSGTPTLFGPSPVIGVMRDGFLTCSEAHL